MEETLFASGNITITRTLAKFGSVTYPIANIGSASTADEPNGGMSFSIFLATFFGIGLGIVIHWIVGLVIFIGGFWLAFKIPTKKRLVLKTSSGDVNALVSSNSTLISDVKSAIEKAFTMR